MRRLSAAVPIRVTAKALPTAKPRQRRCASPSHGRGGAVPSVRVTIMFAAVACSARACIKITPPRAVAVEAVIGPISRFEIR